jgi:aspartyl protease family protein
MPPRVTVRKTSVLRDELRRLVHRTAVLALLLGGDCPAASAEDLRDTLQELSRRHAFTIEGLDRIQPEEAQEAVSGELPARLRDLLRNYNHLMISGRGSTVEKLVILGIKRGSPGMPPDPAVSLTRDGPHHRVEAVLTGPNGRPMPVSLIIDTGASNIVLPESMIPALGFRAETLQSSTSQTASGTLPVKIGTLKSVAVGQNRAVDVVVNFVEDRKLGPLHLLGMSYLGRFRFTIDDEKSELILMAR